MLSHDRDRKWIVAVRVTPRTQKLCVFSQVPSAVRTLFLFSQVYMGQNIAFLIPATTRNCPFLMVAFSSHSTFFPILSKHKVPCSVSKFFFFFFFLTDNLMTCFDKISPAGLTGRKLLFHASITPSVC